MDYSKRTLQGMNKKESEFLLDELCNLEIPKDLNIVRGWLNQKKYQNVNSMHELVSKLKKDKTKSTLDIERVYHVLGFLRYMGMEYEE